jgi:hypothetical protein
MLQLNDQLRVADNISPMRANWDLDMLLIHKVLPSQMPRPNVLGPWVTVFA